MHVTIYACDNLTLYAVWSRAATYVHWTSLILLRGVSARPGYVSARGASITSHLRWHPPA